MAKDVIKKESNELVSDQLPTFMEGLGGQGTEGLSQNAITPPRLKLMHATSPELNEYDSLKAGDWINNISMENFGQTINIIPCFMTEAYFLFQPRVPGSTGGLLARAIDGVHWIPSNQVFDVKIDKKGTTVKWKTAETVVKSGLAEWGSFDPSDKGSQPAATHTINCVVILPDHLDAGPMVMSFSRSSLKVGKRFAGNLKIARAPSYGRVFELSSVKLPGPTGDTYLEPRVKAVGFVADENLFKTSKSIYDIASTRGVDVSIGDDEASPVVNNELEKESAF